MTLVLLFTALGVLCAASIIVYATFLLIKRLRKGNKKSSSFKDWIKHVLEAVMGL